VPDLDDCYLAAIRILNYRFKSEAELRRKLRSKRFDNADVATTITRLRDEGWVNDERFAGSYIRTRQQKRIGVRRIEHELLAAGVDDEIVRQAISENSDEDREREDLAAVCDKRRRLLVRQHGAAFLETAEGRKKLAVYLLNQGYDATLVRSVIKETPVADD